jgi:hypothetical protein
LLPRVLAGVDRAKASSARTAIGLPTIETTSIPIARMGGRELPPDDVGPSIARPEFRRAHLR